MIVLPGQSFGLMVFCSGMLSVSYIPVFDCFNNLLQIAIKE